MSAMSYDDVKNLKKDVLSGRSYEFLVEKYVHLLRKKPSEVKEFYNKFTKKPTYLPENLIKSIKKTSEIKNKIHEFKLNETVKLKYLFKYGNNFHKYKCMYFKGKVIFISDHIIVLKNKHKIEVINTYHFYTKTCEVIHN